MHLCLCTKQNSAVRYLLLLIGEKFCLGKLRRRNLRINLHFHDLIHINTIKYVKKRILKTVIYYSIFVCNRNLVRCKYHKKIINSLYVVYKMPEECVWKFFEHKIVFYTKPKVICVQKPLHWRMKTLGCFKFSLKYFVSSLLKFCNSYLKYWQLLHTFWKTESAIGHQSKHIYF